MNKVKLKALSANKAWGGRTFKSKEYKKFEVDMDRMLPKIKVPDGKLFLRLEFGFSSRASDIDNPTKMTIDCLARKYNFDDKNIYLLEVAKEITKKGEEYIMFDISGLD